jgi:HPt (histidine-containing phosphotransfer) domain-containing protein
MNDHLAKPIDPDKLFEALLHWIRPRTVSQENAAPPTGKVVTVGGDSTPMQIPGIDTQGALKRTGGNRQRYESLLRRFADSQANAVYEIRAALSVRDTATAQRAAHSLKGAAANLGANDLATSAGNAETAIKTESEVEPALRELATELAASIGAINTALPTSEKEEIHADENGNPAAAAESLSCLKRLLETDDSEAAEFILEKQGTLSATLTRTEIETLIRMVGDFDYEGALRALSVITERLSTKIG